MIILIISNIVFVSLFLKYYLLNKKSNLLLINEVKIHEKEEAKIKELTSEKEVIEMELGFVKGIYRNKLVKLAKENEKETTKKSAKA